jgi:hypothetical protein
VERRISRLRRARSSARLVVALRLKRSSPSVTCPLFIMAITCSFLLGKSDRYATSTIQTKPMVE